MDNIINFLKDHFFNIISFFISLILPIYIWKKQERKKEFTYYKTSRLLSSRTPSSAIIITRFIIWNSGKGEIRREDLYQKYLLQIKSSGNVNILGATLKKVSRIKHGFKKIIHNNNLITIDFECVEERSGVVIDVIHNGNAKHLNPTVEIKGGNRMRVYKITLRGIIKCFFTLFVVIILAVAGIILILSHFPKIMESPHLSTICNICGVLLGLLVTQIYTYFPYVAIPHDLREYRNWYSRRLLDIMKVAVESVLRIIKSKTSEEQNSH